MTHVFISYSHRNADYAHKLKKALEHEGFDVWIDDHIDYGDEWPMVIQERLDACDAFILIASEDSYRSKWVQKEVARAQRINKAFFPLLLSGQPWLTIESTQYVDVRNKSLPTEKFYQRLARVTSRDAKDPPPPPPKPWISREALERFFHRILPIFRILAFLTIIAALIWVGSWAITKWMETQNKQMVLVPEGKFIMGDTVDNMLAECQKIGISCAQGQFTVAEPPHELYLDAFYIDRYEVTNKDYADCVRSGKCSPPELTKSFINAEYYGNPQFDNYPVIYVNWYQAKAYCEWRGSRLPTEAEWEKAAQSTSKSIYPWGSDLNESVVNFCDKNCTMTSSYKRYDDGFAEIAPVGSFEKGQSQYGAYDMVGNVWEWVSSLYKAYPYNAADGREDLSASGYRMIRGGSWMDPAQVVRSSFRFGRISPDRADADLGFRCARDAAP